MGTQAPIPYSSFYKPTAAIRVWLTRVSLTRVSLILVPAAQAPLTRVSLRGVLFVKGISL